MKVSIIFEAVNNITATVRSITKEINEVTRSSADLTAAAKETASAGADQAKSLDAVTQSSQGLTEAAKETASAGASQAKSLETVTHSTKDLTAAARANASASVEQARGLSTVELASQTLRTAQEELHASMMKVAAMNLAGDQVMRTGQKILGPISSAVRVAGSFERSMSGVRAVTGATGEEFDKLTKSARHLGDTTEFSASQAAEGMRFLGMAGLKTEQIIAAMPSMLDLALVGELDLGSAADIASNILSGFRLPAEEMTRVADVLSLTAASSNTDVQMMGETMKYAAPIASQLGVSLEEVAAMAGFLGNVGIQGSMAGTAIRNMMSRLARTTGPVADKIASFGIEVTDANGQLLKMPEVLKNVLEGTAELSDLERTGLFMEIFGERAGGAVAELAASGAGLETFVALLEDSEGEAARMAKIMTDNLAGASKELESALEGLRITVGNGLIPAIRWVAGLLTGLTRRITELTEHHPLLAKGVMLVAGSLGVLAIIGGLAIKTMAGIIGTVAIFKFATVSLVPALKFVALKWLPMATAAVVKFGLALLTTPVGWVLGSLALIAGASWWLYRNWDGVSAWWDDMWQGIVSTERRAMTGIVRGLMAAGGWIDSVYMRIRDRVAGLMDTAWGKVTDFVGNVRSALGSLVDWVSGIFARLTAPLDRLDRLVSFGGDAGNGAGGAGGAASYQPAMAGGSHVEIHAPITIHAGPGADAVDIGKQVRAQFDRFMELWMREQRVQAGGHLYDTP